MVGGDKVPIHQSSVTCSARKVKNAPPSHAKVGKLRAAMKPPIKKKQINPVINPRLRSGLSCISSGRHTAINPSQIKVGGDNKSTTIADQSATASGAKLRGTIHDIGTVNNARQTKLEYSSAITARPHAKWKRCAGIFRHQWHSDVLDRQNSHRPNCRQGQPRTGRFRRPVQSLSQLC